MNVTGKREKQSVVVEKYLSECRVYIDLVDKLNNCSLPAHITHTLPNVVVVGDQSSGKSTLLESLSGISLPKGDGMTTRCPLQMILRHNDTISWRATLKYTSKGVAQMKSFDYPRHVGEAILSAQEEVLQSDDVVKDILTLEVNGHDLPNVTLIDLPGLIATQKITNAPGTKEKLLHMTREYLNKENNIILACVDASKDFETNILIEELKKVDPEGRRTIAVFTKYDLIEDKRKRKLLEELQKGEYHVRDSVIVRCSFGEFRDKEMTLQVKREKEAQYFANDADLERSKIEFGVEKLALKLVRTLVKSVQSRIKDWSKFVDQELQVVKRQLNSLGEHVGDSEEEKLLYVTKVSTCWLKIVIDALSDGYAFLPDDPDDDSVTFIEAPISTWGGSTSTDLSCLVKEACPDVQSVQNFVEEVEGWGKLGLYHTDPPNACTDEEVKVLSVERSKVSLHYQWTVIFKEFSRNIRRLTTEKFASNGEYCLEKLKLLLRFGTYDTAPSNQADRNLKRILNTMPNIYKKDSLMCLDKIRAQLTEYLRRSILQEFHEEDDTFKMAIQEIVMKEVDECYNNTWRRMEDLINDLQGMYFIQPDVYKQKLAECRRARDIMYWANECMKEVQQSPQKGHQITSTLEHCIQHLDESLAPKDETVRFQSILRACFEMSDAHLEVGIPTCIRMSMHINFLNRLEHVLQREILRKEFLDHVTFNHGDVEKRQFLVKKSRDLIVCQQLIQEIRRGQFK